MARAARDHVVDDAPIPWALEIFYDCQAFGQFPRVGGWHGQDDLEMHLMKIASRAAATYSAKMAKRKLTPEDAEFLVWVEGEED